MSSVFNKQTACLHNDATAWLLCVCVKKEIAFLNLFKTKKERFTNLLKTNNVEFEYTGLISSKMV